MPGPDTLPLHPAPVPCSHPPLDRPPSCRQARGSSPNGTGVNDTVVNQLLSKIDGVDSLNNILVIGMTNRKDMMDEALLRPGRLEVQVQISLPDEAGRLQILAIHTSKMVEAGYLDAGVDLPELAASTKNFSGAELAIPNPNPNPNPDCNPYPHPNPDPNQVRRPARPRPCVFPARRWRRPRGGHTRCGCACRVSERT